MPGTALDRVRGRDVALEQQFRDAVGFVQMRVARGDHRVDAQRLVFTDTSRYRVRIAHQRRARLSWVINEVLGTLAADPPLLWISRIALPDRVSLTSDVSVTVSGASSSRSTPSAAAIAAVEQSTSIRPS